MTPQQEKFALAIVSGKNQSEAYREAYNVKSGTKPATIHKRASELMKNGEVAGRIEELQKQTAKEAQITLQSHLDDLKKLRNAAIQSGHIAAAITAEVARGKAAGVHIEKQEITQVTRSLTPLRDEDWI